MISQEFLKCIIKYPTSLETFQNELVRWGGQTENDKEEGLLCDPDLESFLSVKAPLLFVRLIVPCTRKEHTGLSELPRDSGQLLRESPASVLFCDLSLVTP